MAKIKAFCSFKHDQDKGLKNDLLAQSKRQDSPFSLADWSLPEAQPEAEWLEKAKQRIAKCDLVIVVLSLHTHQASGVIKEVGAARQMGKQIVQLKPQNQNCKPVEGAGEVIEWTWPNLSKLLGGGGS